MCCLISLRVDNRAASSSRIGVDWLLQPSAELPIMPASGTASLLSTTISTSPPGSDSEAAGNAEGGGILGPVGVLTDSVER
jgi:hypothetical protein